MNRRRLIYLISAVLVLGIGLSAPPTKFPTGKIFSIADGQSVMAVAKLLANDNLIKWPTIFRLALALEFGREDVVVAGDYFFDRPINVWRLAGRLTRGHYGQSLVKVTLPEGITVREMAQLIAQAIPNFDLVNFIVLGEENEGYLFPDTYFFLPTLSPEKILERLQKNFKNSTKHLAPVIADSGRTLEQIIIMASLLEKEAATSEVRQTIAGILWKRLDAGMPLQVDAVFPYIIGKNTFEVSLKDLATSSPYNTYRYRGLPIGPIGNPGLAAIEAALNPIETPYWFYLSDRNGQMHYATDFAGHKLNRVKYLP